MRELNIELIEKQSDSICIDKTDSYIISYPFLIDHFNKIDPITLNDFVTLCHIIYGWMPRILRLKLNNEQKILEIVNKAKTENILTESEINSLVGVINRSLVGTSKLLHFINPNIYPIIDSKIFEFLTGKKVNKYSLKAEYYLDYQKKIYSVIKNEKFISIHEKIEEKLHYSITAVRAAELIIFQTAEKDE